MTLCPYFNLCGGCAYQDKSPEEYRTIKYHFIQQALAHQGIDYPLSQIIEIPLARRRRATFAYTQGHLGFNAQKSHQIIEIEKCPLLLPELEAQILPLRKLAGQLPSSGDIAVLMTDFGADIAITLQKESKKRFHKKKNKAPTLQIIEAIKDFCQNNFVARFVYEETIMYQKTQLSFPSNVFMQPSKEGEQALINLVLQGTKESHFVVDLFCGLGTFTKPLQAQGKKVVGYDITEEAINSLKAQGVIAYTRDLFRQPLLASELNCFDCAVLDPARAGALSQVEQIAQSSLRRVVMVSCNPLTFAKDCKVLCNSGFTFEQITPVDQFPFTSHIEVVAFLARKL